MNLRVVAHALQRYREVDSPAFPQDVNIVLVTAGVEAIGYGVRFSGKHTDNDSITLVMPNGEKWRITMERIS